MEKEQISLIKMRFWLIFISLIWLASCPFLVVGIYLIFGEGVTLLFGLLWFIVTFIMAMIVGLHVQTLSET